MTLSRQHRIILTTLAALLSVPLCVAADKTAPTADQPVDKSVIKEAPANGAIIMPEDRKKTSPNAAGVSKKDAEFVTTAAQAGLFEVEAAKLASTKATQATTRQFAQRMVTDHSAANRELTTLAQRKGYRVPTSLDKPHQQRLAQLQKKSGAAFDRAYSEAMAEGHDKAVALFHMQATAGEDTDLKALADRTLPTLEAHKRMAHDLHGTASGSSDSMQDETDSKSSH